ncbi:hypothetical protein BJX61DRAFT_537973 [Aspergillus egyptiacus]|nr:hypothetical protein BJX61DRAFT_537973 [Aspergillus egyptiacus]
MSDAMMGYAPDAVKGHLPALPWRYPPPPASGLTYWNPASQYSESVRSDTPHTDSRISRSLSSPRSYVSGFESSPSPASYHEPLPMGIYEPEPLRATNPAHAMLQSGPAFIAFPPQIEYASQETNPDERPKSPGETPSTRKGNSQTRVHKRSKAPHKTSSRSKARTRTHTTSKQNPKKPTDRRFECCFSRYGCTSTFPNKNEWKRHVSSQHIQQGFYRCDVGQCRDNTRKCHTASSERPPPQSQQALVNDFNRKDLFVQHLRRMHAPWISIKARKNAVTEEERQAFESNLENIWKRCWRQLRLPPMLSRCGFCAQEFRGHDAWKERMEHVARHLEQADPGPEEEDVPLREWAAAEGIIQVVNGEWRLSSLCRK